jgi:hypothetical protein
VDGSGVKQVQLAVLAVLILTMNIERMAIDRKLRKRFGVLLLCLMGNFSKPNASDAGSRPGEIFVDQLLVETDGFEDLGATVRLDR